MNGHCNKRRYSVVLHVRNVYIISICNVFYRQGQKSIFNNTKFDIFEDKYRSQDLTPILHNTLDGEPASLLSPGHSHTANTRR